TTAASAAATASATCCAGGLCDNGASALRDCAFARPGSAWIAPTAAIRAGIGLVAYAGRKASAINLLRFCRRKAMPILRQLVAGHHRRRLELGFRKLLEINGWSLGIIFYTRTARIEGARMTIAAPEKARGQDQPA